MVLKSDQERVMTLLKDTITLLCKNGLEFKSKFSVDAVIGVTVDEKDLFYISMNEIVKSDKPEEKSDHSGAEDSSVRPGPREHKRKKRKRRIKTEGEGASDGEGSGEQSDSSQGGEQLDFPTSEMEEPDLPSTSEQDPSIKRVKKEEDVESDEDIVFIKQELDDNSWSQSDISRPGGNMSYQDYPQSTQQQPNQNFPSLSDMSLIPVSGAEGNSSGMWSTSSQQQQRPQQQQHRPYIPRGPRTSTSYQQPPGNSAMPASAAEDPQQISSRYTCSICNKRCTTRGNLKKHEDWHEGKYQYYCPYCQKGYMSTSDLRGHISWHTGIKEFKCHLCEKDFRYKRQLKDHINTHVTAP